MECSDCFIQSCMETSVDHTGKFFISESILNFHVFTPRLPRFVLQIYFINSERLRIFTPNNNNQWAVIFLQMKAKTRS